MSQIIVTVCDKEIGMSYDTEVPNDLPIGLLLDDLIQSLMGADPSLYWDLERTVLYSPKIGYSLDEKHSLFEEGIWNGDYLYLRQREEYS